MSAAQANSPNRDQPTEKTLLVTGASGLLGGNLVQVASQRGYQVLATYHRHAVRFPGARALALDLADAAAVAEVIEMFQPRTIIHCAALTDVDYCEAHPDEAWRQNCDATRTLARFARQTGGKFVYVSTDAVYDGARGEYSEADEPSPINIYARSKLAGEAAALEEHPEALVARTTLYGCNIRNKFSLAEWVLHRLQTEQPITGFADVYFSPLLADDLSEVLLDLVEREAHGIFNVGAAEGVSKYDFACRVAELFALPRERIECGSIARATLKAPRPRNTTLNVAKAESRLGQPMPGIDAGLRQFKQLRESGAAQRLKSYCVE